MLPMNGPELLWFSRFGICSVQTNPYRDSRFLYFSVSCRGRDTIALKPLPIDSSRNGTFTFGGKPRRNWTLTHLWRIHPLLSHLMLQLCRA
jgi:hypothetical protein